MILLIDNYDSFSYNLYQLIGSINPDIRVIRNDAMAVSAIRALAPEAIILSPGPGHPEDAGICMDVVKELGSEIPLLGVCLGHQAICTAFGATVSYAKELMHGKQSLIEHDGTGIFQGIPSPIHVARYHSLAVDENTLPEEFQILARTADGEIMAMKHRNYPVVGIQFHPESIFTDHGKKMIENFLFHM